MTDKTLKELKAERDAARAFYAAALDRSRSDYDWHASAEALVAYKDAAYVADAAWIAVTKAEDAYEEARKAQEKTDD